jgi:hypothetical protein
MRSRRDTLTERAQNKEAMLEDLRRVAAEADGLLTVRLYAERGHFGKTAIIETWQRWSTAVQAAGITLSKKQRHPARHERPDYGRRVSRKLVVKQCKRCDGPYTGDALDLTERWCAVCRYALRNNKTVPADGWEYEHCGVEWRIA